MYLKNILVMPMMMHMDILIYTQGFHKNATPLCCINERVKIYRINNLKFVSLLSSYEKLT